MVQAARSGVQNIAEGSMASATSKKTELKLTSVARASLEELLLDYEDFLRHRGLPIWDKSSPKATGVRRRYQGEASAGSDPREIATATPEIAANTLICLINQASYLLGRQLQRLEEAFLDEGGFSERLYKARSASKAREEYPTSVPVCPDCGKPMILRTARRGGSCGATLLGLFRISGMCRNPPGGGRHVRVDRPVGHVGQVR